MPEELEQNQQDTGWYYFLASPAVYPTLRTYVDTSRGYPIGGAKAATINGLPPADELKIANDGSGNLMLQLETWRVSSDDLATLDSYIDAGDVSMITRAEFEALKPEEDEELLDIKV